MAIRTWATRPEFAFIALGTAIGIVASLTTWYGEWIPNRTGTVADISSSFGPLIIEILDHGRYGVCDAGTCAHTERLPFVPFFHSVVSILFGRDLFLHVLFKNVLVYAGIGMIGLVLYKRQMPFSFAVAVVVVLALNPLSFRSLSGLGGEENYYFPIVLACFVVLALPTPRRVLPFIAVGLGLLVLVLTKSTLGIFSLGVAGLILITVRPHRYAVLPFALVLVGFASWSLWSQASTGHWTLVTNISSYDGVNFYKGNNEYVRQLYPHVHLDAVDNAGLTAVPPGTEEWTAGRQFFERGKDWLMESPADSAEFLAFKLFTFLLYPAWPGEIYLEGDISIEDAIAQASAYEWQGSSVARAVLLAGYKVMFLCSLAIAVVRLTRAASRKRAVTYLVFVALLAGPMIVGFAYTIHLALIYNLALLYLGIELLQPSSRSTLGVSGEFALEPHPDANIA